MVLATDMKFLGKGTPVGEKVVENADVKRRACAVSNQNSSTSIMDSSREISPATQSYKSKMYTACRGEIRHSQTALEKDSDTFLLCFLCTPAHWVWKETLTMRFEHKCSVLICYIHTQSILFHCILFIHCPSNLVDQMKLDKLTWTF